MYNYVKGIYFAKKRRNNKMANELVTWSDDFLVHNAAIDEQHKSLVKMANEFYANCQKGGILARVYFFETIKGTLRYVKTHFSTEEDIMKKANYPEYEEHKKQHEDFIIHVQEQISNFEKQINPDSAGFVKILTDWILQHIAASDKDYIPYIAKLNV